MHNKSTPLLEKESKYLKIMTQETLIKTQFCIKQWMF